MLLKTHTMKLFKTLLLLSILLTSCSSNDDNSDDEIEINTQIEITFSGDGIGTSTFKDLDFGLHQDCAIFTFYANTAFQNESITVASFIFQLEELTFNPNETYSFDGPAVNDFLYPINLRTEVNSEFYEATYITTEVTSRFYKEQEFCGEFYGRVFDINFTVTLEHSSGNLAPITITGNTIDLPIEDNCGC